MSFGYWSSELSDICTAACIAFELVDTSGVGILICLKVADILCLLLKPCSKGSRMDCWESLFINLHHRHNILIDEQQGNDNNPLFELVSIPRDLKQPT